MAGHINMKRSWRKATIFARSIDMFTSSLYNKKKKRIDHYFNFFVTAGLKKEKASGRVKSKLVFRFTRFLTL